MKRAGPCRHYRSPIHWLEASGELTIIIIGMLAFAVIATPAAQAQTQTYRVPLRFDGTDGWEPLGDLIRDSTGNLYGTTFAGGASNAGVVFKLDTTGTETVLYSFTGGADGGYPYARLLRDPAGSLYGTTNTGGGGGTALCGFLCGVVFKLDTTGTETVLHSFTGGADGAHPEAGLIEDSEGNLYGTTNYGGGTSNVGIVFKLDTTGTETVLYRFTGEADGGVPNGLIRDSGGNLYGTTIFGGIVQSPSGWGVVFKLDTTGTETVLHSFTGGADGAESRASLVRGSAGNLYGTTNYGGIANDRSGHGVVFKLDTTTGTETVLYTFTGGADGGVPNGLIRDSAGNLYGTTQIGGTHAQQGVVFRLRP